MFCRSICWLLCVCLAAATPAGAYVITESDPEVTLTADELRYGRRTPDVEVKKTAAVDLSSLLDAGEGAIVTLVAGDTRLAAHRAVLAARSPVFAASFDDDKLEAGKPVVTVTDVEGPVLRLLVAYMYTLQAPKPTSMAPQLLVAADRYGMSALKAVCEQQVIAQLSVENAAASALLAIRNSYDSLRQATVAFIKENIFHVMASKGWADAMRSQPEDLIKVIRLLSGLPAETSDHSQPDATSAPLTDLYTTSSTDDVTVPRLSDYSQPDATSAPPMDLYTTSSTDDAAVPRLRDYSEEDDGTSVVFRAEQESVEQLSAGEDEETRRGWRSLVGMWGGR